MKLRILAAVTCVPVVTVAGAGAAQDGDGQYFERGSAWAAPGVSTECLIAVAGDEVALLRHSDGRQAARNKAQILAGVAVTLRSTRAQFVASAESDRIEQAELVRMGALSPTAAADDQAEWGRLIDDAAKSLADLRASYQSCDFPA